MRYIVHRKRLGAVVGVRAWWLGGLATSGEGDILVTQTGERIEKSKSDVLVEIVSNQSRLVVGVSVKTCNNPTPTNDQLYFTTAVAFCNLLRSHGIPVPISGENALRMFCGDTGLRPRDVPAALAGRSSDPDRWFWEELPEEGRQELEATFQDRQREITAVLLQKAYPGDPFPPEFVLHQTVGCADLYDCEVAIFSVDELIDLSCRYRGFWVKPYKVIKGTYKGDPNTHHAPRFGFIQFQRGGQKQHPTQLQFNLEAGYFYKLPAR